MFAGVGNHDRRRVSAFTLAEILVACVVMSTALLGTHALFSHAMDVEGKASARWSNQEAAGVLADYLAEIVATTVNLPKVNALVLKKADDGCILICHTASARHRFRWFQSENSSGYVMELRSMPFVGKKALAPGVDWEGEDTPAIWNMVRPAIIASRLSKVSIQYRPSKEPDEGWKDEWKGRAGEAAIRISIGVDDQQTERVVVPQANADITEQ